jgi:hypothetical protein
VRLSTEAGVADLSPIARSAQCRHSETSMAWKCMEAGSCQKTRPSSLKPELTPGRYSYAIRTLPRSSARRSKRFILSRQRSRVSSPASRRNS